MALFHTTISAVFEPRWLPLACAHKAAFALSLPMGSCHLVLSTADTVFPSTLFLAALPPAGHRAEGLC